MDLLEQHREPKELGKGYFMLRGIKAYHDPLDPNHPDYKGSSYNLLVEWETGEVTYQTFMQMSMDVPASFVVYSKKHNLLDKSEWNILQRFSRTSNILIIPI